MGSPTFLCHRLFTMPVTSRVADALAAPGNELLREFVLSKVVTFEPIEKKVSTAWPVRLFTTWRSPSMTAEVKKNRKKMEMVLAVWRKSFIGCGLETIRPDMDVLKMFRGMVRSKLHCRNEAAVASNERCNARRNGTSPSTVPSNVEDYFTQDHARVDNRATVNKLAVARVRNPCAKTPRVSLEANFKPDPDVPPTPPGMGLIDLTQIEDDCNHKKRKNCQKIDQVVSPKK